MVKEKLRLNIIKETEELFSEDQLREGLSQHEQKR